MNTTTAYTFDDILLIPQYNEIASRKDTDISVTDKTGKVKTNLPVFTSNMDTITEDGMSNYISSKGGLGVLHRFCTIERNLEMFKQCTNKNTFVSLGTSKSELERFEALRDSGANNFCIDVAHGHASYIGKMLRKLRELGGSSVCLMAGNVSTYEGADYLVENGADIVKVGVGGGSVCSTRIKTGFGVPTLWSVRDCAKVGVSIVADGGLRTPGDIVKALAFGADFVMIGGMLSGTDPTPGKTYYDLGYEIVEATKDNTHLEDPRNIAMMRSKMKKIKQYRGMASKEVADDNGGLTAWKTAEGVATTVQYKNEQQTDDIISDIVGGLRSGLTYSGSRTIKELQDNLNYIVITNAGRVESLPHALK